jgi:hypothetical protein
LLRARRQHAAVTLPLPAANVVVVVVGGGGGGVIIVILSNTDAPRPSRFFFSPPTWRKSKKGWPGVA